MRKIPKTKAANRKKGPAKGDKPKLRKIRNRVNQYLEHSTVLVRIQRIVLKIACISIQNMYKE